MGEGLLISVPFWGAFILYAILDRAGAGLLPLSVRYLLCAAASAGFLWYFTDLPPRELACLYTALAIIFYSVTAMSRGIPGQGRAAGLYLVVGVVALIWTVGKIGDSIKSPSLSMLFFLGASYVFVKIWTFSKDYSDGRITNPSLPAFLAYISFFPCYQAGPMHDYNEFTAAFERRETLDGPAWINTIHRLMLGLVKLLVICVALDPFSLRIFEASRLSAINPVELLWRCPVEGFRIYINFSGYCDIAISASRILGIAVPENFRWPYFATNLREFWQRWHITFTRVLTQYLFIPFTRMLQTRHRTASPTTTSTVAYLVTFLFCGFWHGSTVNFLAWGAYHGGALAIYDYIRQNRLAAARAEKRLIAPPSLPMRVLSTVITFAVVSVGWLLFSLPLSFWTH